ncbi:MAG TPA: hypothetical protein VFD82_01185 [Planctomycetota bacterium]|nr:hypothetical protein [Planctomycetota bacterium]
MRVCCWVVALLGCSCGTVEVPHRAGAAAGSAAAGPLLMDSFACEVPAVAAPCCERATTVAEWKALRQRLGGAIATLPDSWCDFGAEAVVAVATAAAAVRPGFVSALAEEEGVDVLTLTQERIAAGAARSWGIVVKTARHPAQLAVVLRRNGPGSETAEQTLGVFAGL